MCVATLRMLICFGLYLTHSYFISHLQSHEYSRVCSVRANFHFFRTCFAHTITARLKHERQAVSSVAFHRCVSYTDHCLGSSRQIMNQFMAVCRCARHYSELFLISVFNCLIVCRLHHRHNSSRTV